MSLREYLHGLPLLIIDGALATEMEKRGADLHDPLWSAKYLIEEPERIAAVHFDYLCAGADVLITASYQASIPGFMARGMSRAQAYQLIQTSVDLAHTARANWCDTHSVTATRWLPLIAGSVGPYGAYTADGGEYRGNYGLSAAQLREFHLPRIDALVTAGVDFIACETIPDLFEATVLAEVLAEYPGTEAWMSFSCGSGVSTYAGQSINEVAQTMAQYPHILALGANCTAPQYIPAIITTMRATSNQAIVVYPNSGEQYDAHSNTWSGIATCDDYVHAAQHWYALGANAIGGCCRTDPATIAAVRAALVGASV
jgi:homocysteine S-methyltransferase